MIGDPVSIASQVAGPFGYFVAEAATTQKFGNPDEKPFALKLMNDLTKLVKPFGAEGDEVMDAAGDAADALGEAGTGADLLDDKGTKTKSYSVLDWIVFGVTIIAIITSWTLNNDKNVRIKLGYENDGLSAGILMSLLSILAIFMFGPWLYFLFLLAPLFQFLPFLDTVNKRYWIEGVKDAFNDVNVPSRDKTILRYLSMLPQGMQSGVAVSTKVIASPAQFGHFYY
jgi:hypothetical protein